MRGVIYIATGRKYIEEAFKSAESLKAATPSIEVTLFCDQQLSCPYIDEQIIIAGPQREEKALSQAVSTSKGMFNKVYYMDKSPYERTLFLDTDTYIVNDISDLFPLLDRFDIAAAHAPHRIPRGLAQRSRFQQLPSSFPVMNTGVLLYKKSARTNAFFSQWLRLCQDPEYVACNDQTSFRVALYKSDLRIATLTPEYNYRFRKRLCINGTLKILHGRHPNLHAIARQANALVARGIAGPAVPSMWFSLIKSFVRPLSTISRLFRSAFKSRQGLLGKQR